MEPNPPGKDDISDAQLPSPIASPSNPTPQPPQALDAATVQSLVSKLDQLSKTQDLLIQALANSGSLASPRANRLTADALQRNAANLDVESLSRDSASATITTDDLYSEGNESIFVQTPLEPEEFTEEGLRKHIKSYPWTEFDKSVLCGLKDNDQLFDRSCIFPTEGGPQADRSHVSHYSIFDIGADGAPLEVRTGEKDRSRSLAIWNRMKSVNADPKKERQAVGRITIVREPSPLLFAACHYTHNKHFDVDELFEFMVDDGPELIHPHRAFDYDDRRQRSFVFTMEYFTIMGEDCQPMTWQVHDENAVAETHIPISRCSAVVGLSLEGPHLSKVKNKDRRQINKKYGYVYDPFSPWRVLSITAYPDWKSSVDTFDSSKHYVNGPEAFLAALMAEYRDARKRLMEVYERVSDLVEPPPDFIFNQRTRDMLLFEDQEFTYSRRYFWAWQTLDIMNQDIHEMITAYRNTFKENVWEGSNKIIWPGEDTLSPRYAAWRKRMAGFRRDFDYEIERLEEIQHLNDKKIKGIKALRDNLFSGTSVQESRRSVEMAETTVMQGNNIKLLTLVTIFFLPLTFVTSVFGMTNMDPDGSFLPFAWSTLAICIPTYLLIGSLNSRTGLKFWSAKTRATISAIGAGLAWILNSVFHYYPRWTHAYRDRVHVPDLKFTVGPRKTRRSSTDQEAMMRRENMFDDPPTFKRSESAMTIDTRAANHSRAATFASPISPTTSRPAPRSNRKMTYPPAGTIQYNPTRSSTFSGSYSQGDRRNDLIGESPTQAISEEDGYSEKEKHVQFEQQETEADGVFGRLFRKNKNKKKTGEDTKV